MKAASEYSHVVRLPDHHGVLVTDPVLAVQLLKSGAVRDVAAYQRFKGFLGDALVLLPQTADVASSPHSHLRAALLPLFTPAAIRPLHRELIGCIMTLLNRLAESARRGAGHHTRLQPPASQVDPQCHTCANHAPPL